MLVYNQVKILENLIIITIGKIKAISTSKIKKIIEIKKNRIEKGIRDEFIGSNPHSKGDLFSRSVFVFFDKKEANIIIIIVINIVIKDIRLKFMIIYTKFFRLYDWKSYIHYYIL